LLHLGQVFLIAEPAASIDQLVKCLMATAIHFGSGALLGAGKANWHRVTLSSDLPLYWFQAKSALADHQAASIDCKINPSLDLSRR
jgi:hypothetical protein